MQSRVIRNGQTETIRISNTNVKSLRFDVHHTVDTDASGNAFAGGRVNFDDIHIEVILHQFRERTTIFSGKLLPYLLFFENALHQRFNPADSYMNVLNIDFKDSDKKVLVPAQLPIGTILNLDNDDGQKSELVVKITVGREALGKSDKSFMKFAVETGIGVQGVIPTYKQLLLPITQVNFSENLGDDIIDLDLVTTDVAHNGYFMPKYFESLTIRSDKFNEDYDYEQILAKMYNTNHPQGHELPTNKLSIYSGHNELDELTVDMTLTAKGQEKQQLYLVYSQIHMNSKLIEKSRDMERKHANKAEKKIKSVS